MTKAEILQVAKPILFNTEMVRAILDGRKRVTRRLIKPQPPTGAIVEYNGNKGIYWSWWMDGDKHFAPKDGIKKATIQARSISVCPGNVGVQQNQDNKESIENQG